MRLFVRGKLNKGQRIVNHNNRKYYFAFDYDCESVSWEDMARLCVESMVLYREKEYPENI